MLGWPAVRRSHNSWSLIILTGLLFLVIHLTRCALFRGLSTVLQNNLDNFLPDFWVYVNTMQIPDWLDRFLTSDNSVDRSAPKHCRA